MFFMANLATIPISQIRTIFVFIFRCHHSAHGWGATSTVLPESAGGYLNRLILDPQVAADEADAVVVVSGGDLGLCDFAKQACLYDGHPCGVKRLEDVLLGDLNAGASRGERVHLPKPLEVVRGWRLAERGYAAGRKLRKYPGGDLAGHGDNCKERICRGEKLVEIGICTDAPLRFDSRAFDRVADEHPWDAEPFGAGFRRAKEKLRTSCFADYHEI